MKPKRRIRGTPNVVQSIQAVVDVALSVATIEDGRFVVDHARPAKSAGEQIAGGTVDVGVQTLAVAVLRRADGRLIARFTWADREEPATPDDLPEESFRAPLPRRPR